MSGAVDFITILQARTCLLAKSISGDANNPYVRPYDDEKWFDLHEEPLDGLDDLADLLGRLLPCNDCCVVRGKIADPKRVRHVRRLLHSEATYKATLIDAPHYWLAIDFDNVARPDDVAASDLAGCAALAIATLPVEFHGAACIVQASASHGIKPGCRLRLWFWLNRLTSGEELKAWLPDTDTSVYRAAQPVYTANPIISQSIPDPVPLRLLTQPGRPVVVVPPRDVLMPPAPPRAAVVRSAVPVSSDWFARKVAWRIEDACDKVAEAEDGQKHNALYAAAFWLGGHLHYGTHDAADIADQLMAALPSSAKDLRLARKTVEQGLAAGRDKPVSIEGPTKPAVDISGLLAKTRKVVTS